MSSLFQIEKIISQNNYRLAINILEKKTSEEQNNHLYFYLLGNCYYQIKEFQKAYFNIQKAVNIQPYGIYKNIPYSKLLNELAVSGLVDTGRKKIILDSYDKESVHAIALYPLADVYFLDNMDVCMNPDYFIVPNWLSPYHPLYEKIESLNIPVVSMIVDRIIHAEEHVRANLIYSDIIFVMENYAVELYKRQGFTNVVYVPCAGSVGYDPLAYPKLGYEKTYDVVFLGNISASPIYTKRRKMLDKLESLKEKYNIVIKSVTDYEEYWNITNKAKIIIDHTIDSKGLNFRMFQAMGTGVLCFVEENDMVAELYENNKDLVMYNLDNLESLLDYYLSNPEQREAIAANGNLKTINNCTHYHMFKMVIDKLEENNFVYPTQKKSYGLETFNLYKGVAKHYQNKFIEALEIFKKLNNSSEKSNNIMVQLIKLEESENINNQKEIDEIFNTYNNNLIITFNYILYLKYIKKDSTYIKIIKELLDNIGNYDSSTGLIFLPVADKKFTDNFKFKQGDIIFKYGIDSKEYIKELHNIIKEALELLF